MLKVSIILPTHNGEKYIRNAIQSVQAQSFSDWELIVVDDGSTALTTSGSISFDSAQDKSFTTSVLTAPVASDSSLIKEIVNAFTEKDHRIKYFRNEKNLGIQKSLNKGLREAKGEYIARIDDDDEWIDKTKLQKQVEFLDKNPDYVLVGAGVIVVGDPLRHPADGGDEEELFRYLNPETDYDIRQKILGRNCFSHSSVVFRKQAALKAGLYPETKKTLHAEDYWLWLKLGLFGKFCNLRFYGIKFMLRQSAVSSKNKVEQFWHDILIVWEFRRHYPNFVSGFLRSWLRLVLYGVGGFFPFLRLKYLVMKQYKSL